MEPWEHLWITRGCWSWPTGRRSKAFAVGHRPESGVVAGEVVFNTALVGYQEIVTDPSYAGQIITFTYPHIGNYGVNGDDNEARAPHCRGVIVRDLARRASNWRATEDLQSYLERQHIAGIAGSRHPPPDPSHPLRRRDARGVRRRRPRHAARGRAGRRRHRRSRPRRRRDHHRAVQVGPDDARFFVVAYDFGIKRSILDQLVQAGCQVEVVPAATPAADVLQREPDGVFLSNGPGDPAPVDVRARQRAARCSARCRCSASASVTRSWRSRSVRRRSSCGSGITAATTPYATSGRVTSRSRVRTTTTPSTQRSLPDGADGDAPQSQRRRPRRRPRGRRPRARSACSTTPRPAPARTTRATCSPSSPTSCGQADDAAPHRPRDDPADRQRTDRDRPGLRVRLLGHPGVPRAARRGLPRRARELEPGDDHDRPGVRRRDLRRAADGPVARAHHREGTARRAAARRSAARPDSTSRSRSTRPACSTRSTSR